MKDIPEVLRIAIETNNKQQAFTEASRTGELPANRTSSPRTELVIDNTNLAHNGKTHGSMFSIIGVVGAREQDSAVSEAQRESMNNGDPTTGNSGARAGSDDNIEAVMGQEEGHHVTRIRLDY